VDLRAPSGSKQQSGVQQQQQHCGAREFEPIMSRMSQDGDDNAPIMQGALHKQGGWLDSLWQLREFALMSGTASKPPSLIYANVDSKSDDLFGWTGSLPLSSSASVAVSDGNTDITLSNVKYAHKASGKSTVVLRAESQQSRDQWVAAINAELLKEKSATRAPSS
jgi:hypothetical protein